jgi:diaminohydroxyphosphoribosylaminopyrimidine deaminase / 5-amino-6-(5-phosphoribosylamino)uracil reductase
VKINGSENGKNGPSLSHLEHMDSALNLARRGLGNTWPNPTVGCVIVKNNRVVGRGWTLPGGRPHAETEALRNAGQNAIGSIVYVTLEPCNHYGKTPPCTEALIEAGVKKVVIATLDPDARVSGSGQTRLEEAGISVEVGLSRLEADEINQGFFSRVKMSKPFITLKLATTLDGKIATRNGESEWITGEVSRKAGHKLRAHHDAIMVGSGTVITDNPSLTCRLLGIENTHKLRIILDGRLRVPEDGVLAQTAKKVPVLVFTVLGDKDRSKKVKRLEALGVSVVVIEKNGKHLDFQPIMAELSARGITRLLVEGGGSLAASLMLTDLVDEIAWFRAPTVMGDDGLSGVAELGLDKLDNITKFSRKSHLTLGEDSLEILTRTR